MVIFVVGQICNFQDFYKIRVFGSLTESRIFLEILHILGFIFFKSKLVFY